MGRVAGEHALRGDHAGFWNRSRARSALGAWPACADPLEESVEDLDRDEPWVCRPDPSADALGSCNIKHVALDKQRNDFQPPQDRDVFGYALASKTAIIGDACPTVVTCE